MRTASCFLPLLLLLGCRPRPAEAAFQVAGERAVVYATAESTAQRLTPTDTLSFKPSEPTSEGKVYVPYGIATPVRARRYRALHERIGAPLMCGCARAATPTRPARHSVRR